MGLILPSTVRSAVLILARDILLASQLEGLPESATEICQAVGVSKSQAYEMLGRIRVALEDVQGRSGRPPCEGLPAVERDLLVAVRDFLMDHPGCVEGGGARRVYGEKYRDFVLRQLEPGGAAQRLTHEQAAEIFGVPLGTLKDWLANPRLDAGERKADDDVSAGEGEPPPTAHLKTADPVIATILREFPRWKGSFKGFCRFLESQWRLSCGRTFIASVLEAASLRTPVRRGRERRPWSEDTFRELFPGAQWIGDGKTVVIEWQGQLMAFNFEALIDVSCNAIVGAEVTDTEDEAAVLAALSHARFTTGGEPLCVTLDRKPSNHTAEVISAVAPAELLASIKARPTAKAPIEGCFGLFSQTAPPLVVNGATPREQARSALKLYILGWSWARNRRPRRRLGGRTPIDAYQASRPTDQQVAEAKAWIAELKRREEMSRLTLEAKADPVRRQLLEAALQDLGIADPDDHLAIRLAASYSLEAIIRGLASFRVKVQNGTLPPGVQSGPYLAGIIRNVHAQLEDVAYAEALLDLRIRARDLSLQALEKEADLIARTTPPEGGLRSWAYLRRAMEVQPLLDFRFYVGAFRDSLAALPPWMRKTLYNWMSSEISQAFHAPRDRRRELIATLSSIATLAVG
jgi:transposase InsO family protein/transposase